MTDTIFALSSGHGRAGVAVVRVSGADLQTLFKKIAKLPDTKFPFAGEGVAVAQATDGVVARHAYLTNLVDANGDIIDRAIAIYFANPNSFTGEDVIEFHVHGSPAVLQKLFDVLKGVGARMAEPGEFTRRAFDNGKMDLVEVDGLCALLDSRTDAQRRGALRSSTGADSEVYENWRAAMIEIAAYSAAMLDYPSDELPKNLGDTLLMRTKKLHGEITTALTRADAARAVQSGFNIALVGPVNAGKSSLFNRLVGESRAIVSDIPGTTRDVVSTEIDIDGYLVRLSDTAGLRDTTDTIEKIGIEKTNAEIENADLVIKVQSAKCKVQMNTAKEKDIIVINKSDLLDNNCTLNFEHCALVSALTGRGIPELLEIIKQRVHKMLDGAESEVVINSRTKDLLSAAADELSNAINNPKTHDIFAEHARRAADSIGRILGIIGADEVADATFGQLCLGK